MSKDKPMRAIDQKKLNNKLKIYKRRYSENQNEESRITIQ
jgi:hypothetical protein